MMVARTMEEHIHLRQRYEPQTIQLVIVAESPSVGGKYFYDQNGSRREPLFAALMKQLGVSPGSKEEGLRELQRRGWILVDATYEPVNHLSPLRRNEVILRDCPYLQSNLLKLLRDDRFTTPVILIKRNVCELLEQRLKDLGFNVVNKGRYIPFPSHGWQPAFHREFEGVLRGVFGKALFYITPEGDVRDDVLHDEILNDGDHEAAREVSDGLAKAFLSPEMYQLWKKS